MLPHSEINSDLARLRTQTLLAEAARRRLIESSRRSAPAPANNGLGRAGGAGRAAAVSRLRWSPRRLGLALARVFLVLDFVASVFAVPAPASVEASLGRCHGEAIGPRADLTFCDLTGTDLIGADLRGADLSYANPTGVVTFGWRPVEISPQVASCPAGARATGGGRCSAESVGTGRCGDGNRPFAPGRRGYLAAVASAAPVECWVAGGIDLDSARLVGAGLAGTDLRSANLRYADLAGADLTGATWGGTTCPDGSNSEAHDGDGLTCLGNLGLGRPPGDLAPLGRL